MTRNTPAPSDAASREHLLPRPRHLRLRNGTFSLRPAITITPADPNDPLLAAAARLGRRKLAEVHSPGNAPSAAGRITLERTNTGQGDQAYALHIRPTGIKLRASAEPGFRYGILTLAQLFATGLPAIRAMDIDDWPDFPVRGVMLDISRDKVPTLDTLKSLIDRLAGWKINQLQLYMEHTFAYAGHETVWHGASALTGEQIQSLDAYCRARCIEFAANQNSLGHMERWLKHRRYRRLAETLGPWKTPWGEVRHKPTTLNATDPAALRLVASLYDQLLPNFTSRWINVGCDEPWELGQGRSRDACKTRGADRVFLGHLLGLRRAAADHGRRVMFWADWFMKRKGRLPALPSDLMPLLWGYEADHPFDDQCARLRAAGMDFYVCPGTSSWCSFGGRTGNALANLRNAAAAGRRHGAAGYLVTDWGDFGHRQYLPVSYAGMLYGAALGWCSERNADLDVAAELSRHAFGDPTQTAGRLWLEAGRIHELSPVVLNNRSVLFACMHAPLGDPTGLEGLAGGQATRMAERVDDLIAAARKMRMTCGDARIVKEGLLTTLAVLRHASRRATFALDRREGRIPRIKPSTLANEMRRIIERHRDHWRSRNRSGGLVASVSYYKCNLREYERLK